MINSFTSVDADIAYLVFSRDGNLGTNTYLKIGQMVSSNAGMRLQGTYRLVEMQFSNLNNLANGATITLRQRTARTTWTNITGASITLGNNTYTGTTTLDLLLPADVEISAYHTGGSTAAQSCLILKLIKEKT